MKHIKSITFSLILSMLVAFLSGCGGGGSSTPDPSLTRSQKWQVDIDYLVSSLENNHPNFYHQRSQQEFDSLISDLKGNIDSLTDPEVTTEIFKLIAMGAKERDGHLNPLYYVNTGFKLTPLKFYQFSDGVFVIQASEAYQHLIGKQLVGINGYSIFDANLQVDSILTSDNMHNLEVKRNLVYITPDLLFTLGLNDSRDSTNFILRDSEGFDSTEVVNAINTNQYTLDISYNLPKNASHYYLSSDETFWMNHFEEDAVLYIKINEVQDRNSSETLNDFATRILNVVSNHTLSKVIVDLRQNNGGNNQLIPSMINFIKNQMINQPGKLIVFTDRQTFSAAGNLVAEIAYQTVATFEGIAPGGSGSQFGDTVQIELPYSGLGVLIPTIYWTFGDPLEQPIIQSMHIEKEATSDDYFSGKDPLLDSYISNSN